MSGSQQRSLRGLVVVTNTRHMQVGMNRPLVNAESALQAHGISLTFAGARSTLHFVKDLAKSKRVRFDFVVFNSMATLSSRTPIGYPLWRLFRSLHTATFLYWHETDWAIERRKKTNSRFAEQLATVATSNHTTNLAVSTACAESLERHYPNVAATIIYNCVPEPDIGSLSSLPSTAPVVVSIGSIQPRKGTDLFVETAISACRKHPTVQFVWLGEGNERTSWQKMVQEIGLEDRIHFPGYAPSPLEKLSQASLLFMSSRDDPFPLTVLEAMALGRTVVTFRSGGAVEALGGDGVVVDDFDTEEAADAILVEIDRPATERSNSSLRQRYLDHYTPEKFAQRFASAIRARIED